MFQPSLRAAAKLSAAVIMSLICASVALPTLASAQTPAKTPAATVEEIYRAWTEGGPPSPLLSKEMQQVVAQQTKDTGIYAQLKGVGALQTLDVTGQQSLPKGKVYVVRSVHEAGYVDWLFGIGDKSGLVEAITFQQGVGKPAAAVAEPLCFLFAPELC